LSNLDENISGDSSFRDLSIGQKWCCAIFLVRMIFQNIRKSSFSDVFKRQCHGVHHIRLDVLTTNLPSESILDHWFMSYSTFCGFKVQKSNLSFLRYDARVNRVTYDQDHIFQPIRTSTHQKSSILVHKRVRYSTLNFQKYLGLEIFGHFWPLSVHV
jgi:hypothetical protein